VSLDRVQHPASLKKTMNLQVQQKTGKLSTRLTTTSFRWLRFMVLKCHDTFFTKSTVSITHLSDIYSMYTHARTLCVCVCVCVCVTLSVKILKIKSVTLSST